MKDYFKDKTILITGGTGFLGRALAKKFLEYDLHALRLFSNSEVEHYKTAEEIKDPRIRHFIGDVRDYARLRKAVVGADIVVHAAALKRIDLIEYNVQEAIKTNVVGTLNTVRACLDEEVDKAVFISTDKACSPVNSYGATKFLGERIFIESNFNKGHVKTALFAVRYGNVLASTGSVIPFFKQKIEAGEKIPLTDKRMTRFVITKERAVQEVIDGIVDGVGGETFIPKLESMRIVDLIDIMQEMYGKTGVEETGIRPGEKIHEELINEEEAVRSFELKDRYAIISQIEKYEAHKRFPYLNGKKKFSGERYVSSNFLLDKKVLKERLLKEGILE